MTTILCPTRGGKESQPNQDYAIQLASEQGADILFLYVSDISFISRAGPPIVVDIEEEMAEVGDFLLAMAQERAEKAGVHARTSTRSGNFTKVLRNVILEQKIHSVVLGGSHEDTGAVTQEHLRLLSEELGKELNVEFIVVHRGELIYRTKRGE
jgi:nucleotide-binding universal stress UspA family protein